MSDETSHVQHIIPLPPDHEPESGQEVQPEVANNRPGGEPSLYQSTPLWSSVSLVVAIIIAVFSVVLKHPSILLFVAWPFATIILLEVLRRTRRTHIKVLTVFGSVIVLAVLGLLYAKLSYGEPRAPTSNSVTTQEHASTLKKASVPGAGGSAPRPLPSPPSSAAPVVAQPLPVFRDSTIAHRQGHDETREGQSAAARPGSVDDGAQQAIKTMKSEADPLGDALIGLFQTDAQILAEPDGVRILRAQLETIREKARQLDSDLQSIIDSHHDNAETLRKIIFPDRGSQPDDVRRRVVAYIAALDEYLARRATGTLPIQDSGIEAARKAIAPTGSYYPAWQGAVEKGLARKSVDLTSAKLRDQR